MNEVVAVAQAKGIPLTREKAEEQIELSKKFSGGQQAVHAPGSGT